MSISTVTSKGQTTLPRDVREALALKPGDKVVYIVENGSVRLKAAASVIAELQGAFKKPGLPAQDLDAARDLFEIESARRSTLRTHK